MRYLWAGIITVAILAVMGAIYALVHRRVRGMKNKIAIDIVATIAIVGVIAQIYFGVLDGVSATPSAGSPTKVGSPTTAGVPTTAANSATASPSSGGSSPSAAGSGSGPRQSGSASPAAVLENKVKIVRFDPAPGVAVNVVVDVQGPPSAGNRYILVARFDQSSRFKMKADVDGTVGEKSVQVDLTGAQSGSWRDFAVLAVSESSYGVWKQTVAGDSLPAWPKDGGMLLTTWRPYQLS